MDYSRVASAVSGNGSTLTFSLANRAHAAEICFEIDAGVVDLVYFSSH